MTETPEPMIVAVPAAPDDGDRLIPFVLADDPDSPLVATRPKTAILVQLMAAMGVAENNPLAAAVQIERLLDRVLDADSAAHIRARFNDAEDSLDLDVLQPIMEQMVGRWYKGPTTKPSGSRGSRARSGTSSTGRRRS